MVEPTNQGPPDPTRLHPPNRNTFRKTKVGAKPNQCRTRTKPKTPTPIPTPIIRQLILQQIISIGSVFARSGLDWLGWTVVLFLELRQNTLPRFCHLFQRLPTPQTIHLAVETCGLHYSPVILVMASPATHSFQIINSMHPSAASHDRDQVELRMRQMSYRTSGRSRQLACPLARPPRPARRIGELVQPEEV